MPISDSVAWPSTLPLPLVGPVRFAEPRSQVLTFETGRKRVCRLYDDVRTVYEFEWNFTEDQFDAFQAFFADTLLGGSLPFYITLQDPDDSDQQIITDYGFFEPDYQFVRSDNLFNVVAVMLVEQEEVEVITEPFNPGPCAIIIWPQVSDGEGGGTSFECYDEGDYTVSGMETAGTGIGFVYLSNSPYYGNMEPFTIFAEGDLVLGSPTPTSMLSQMYYGDNPAMTHIEDFESYAEGSIGDGTPPTSTGLTAFYSG